MDIGYLLIHILFLGIGSWYITLAFVLDAEMTSDKKTQSAAIYFLVSEQDPVSYFSY